MATITAQQATGSGTLWVFSAVTASDTFAAADRQALYVKNGSGGSINVTVVDGGSTPAGNASANSVVAVPAGSERVIPIPQAAASPATGFVTVNYSGTTSVTAALVKI